MTRFSITVALALAMVSTVANAGNFGPRLRPVHEAPRCTEYLDDVAHEYKCGEVPGAPQMTCDEDKVAIMFIDRQYHCAWPSEVWNGGGFGGTPEERGEFDPNDGPYEE